MDVLRVSLHMAVGLTALTQNRYSYIGSSHVEEMKLWNVSEEDNEQ